MKHWKEILQDFFKFDKKKFNGGLDAARRKTVFYPKESSMTREDLESILQSSPNPDNRQTPKEKGRQNNQQD